MQEFLTRKQVSERYPISPHTLARLASERRGPRFYKPIDVALYRPEDIEAWIAAAVVMPRPAEGPAKTPHGGRGRSASRTSRAARPLAAPSDPGPTGRGGRPLKSLPLSADSSLRRSLTSGDDTNASPADLTGGDRRG